VVTYETIALRGSRFRPTSLELRPQNRNGVGWCSCSRTIHGRQEIIKRTFYRRTLKEILIFTCALYFFSGGGTYVSAVLSGSSLHLIVAPATPHHKSDTSWASISHCHQRNTLAQERSIHTDRRLVCEPNGCGRTRSPPAR
jgi:hypothetical protein